MCVQAMLMTLYSEFLLTLQIIFRLRRKCNFTEGGEEGGKREAFASACLREVLRYVLRVV